ncbi:MAG: tagaturonate reductase [Clostridia bacterium]|nr:tagaturonate reductase [Clostridia bacterium]
MSKINEVYIKPNREEKIIQFGEGGFLRAFFDWMLQKANDEGVYNGSAVVVQPIEKGMCGMLSEQNCLYTNIIRGVEGVESRVIDVISRCVNPYEDYEAYLSLADNPKAEIIVSNTTESGIAYKYCDFPENQVPDSFPAKLTALLYRRYNKGLKGFLLFPCELIEKNGEKLKEIVLKHAEDWKLEAEFINWINKENQFCNTLVDRIVPGYPRDEKIELDYEDNMINTAEYYHLWVIEGDIKGKDVLTFDKAGLNIIWTDNLSLYRTRKVRILNGAHTSTVAYAMLGGIETVMDVMQDEKMSTYIKDVVFGEIMPTLELPENELKEYAENVLQRFSNPYIKHYWRSISLNSVSKFKVRVLPSLLQYYSRFNKLPEKLVFSLYCLIKMYKTMDIDDDAAVIAKMKNGTVAQILADKTLWDTDLSFLLAEVSKYDNK